MNQRAEGTPHARLLTGRRAAAATAQADLALRRDLIAFQRRTLSDLRQKGRIGITTLRAIEHDLDLEDARLPPA
jgi:hypothetical protein